jgi:hypothetical protein
MKKMLLIAMILPGHRAVACAVCERSQPALLKGITHGSGPDTQWDYLIIAVMMTIVVFTLFFSVKWIAYPGEKSEAHIKRFIINN